MLIWDQRVEGSNPFAPTTKKQYETRVAFGFAGFCFSGRRALMGSCKLRLVVRWASCGTRRLKERRVPCASAFMPAPRPIYTPAYARAYTIRPSQRLAAPRARMRQ